MEQIELLGVNPLPKQTWNYLDINDTKVKVDAPKSLPCCIPSRTMANLSMPLGQQATSYLDQVAKTRRIITIEKNTKTDEPLIVDVDDTTPVASTDITVLDDSDITIIISATSSERTTKGNNLRVVCGDRCNIKIMSVTYSDEKTTYLENVGVSLGNDCNLEAHQYFLGATKIIGGVHTEVVGDNNTFNSYTHYLVKKRQTLDLNYTANIYGTNSKGNFCARGVLFDRAKKTLRQTVDMKKGCSKSDGAENETVLLAGQNIVNKSIPSILCHEDDVEGSHGATIGSISKEQTDYLKAKGLEEKDINNMFADSIVKDALVRIDETTKAYQLAKIAADKLILEA